jgi:hypothetical protein
MSIRSRKLVRIFGALVALYVGVYVVLSVTGRYEPIEWGLRGPKSYQWAPRGFVHEMRWNTAMIAAFLPCWELDRFFWHWEDRMFSGKLPVNEIAEPAAAGNSR